ncbi:hypothetical protein ACSBR1_028813 [Camellia fascicularis]
MRNKWGNTVLHEAVRNHNLRVAEFLIKVDPELACFENNTGESPLYLAARDGMLEIVKRILMAAYLMEALVRAKPELIKEADHHGRTPLYYAASMGDHRTVQRLLQLHTDIRSSNVARIYSGELLDLRGQNTLHFAVLGGKLSVVRYILETTELEGLINQADNDGNTPLHLATRERKKRVDQRAKNNIGQTAIDYEESIRKAYSKFPKKSKNWRQPWSLNILTTKEKIPPSTSKEGATAAAAAADKMETYKQMGHTLLMVATLLATVTFAAAFTIPGGFNNNVGPDQGQALLQSSLHLKWFLVSDSIAMSFSVIAACILFWGAVIAEETYFYYFASATVLTHVALFSTAVAFTTGLIAIMPNQPFVRIMCRIIGSLFHVGNFLFFFRLAQIFSSGEVCQFLIFRLCRLKTKFIKR